MASNRDTFSRPAFDESRLYPQWMQYNAEHSPNHPLFVFESEMDSGIRKTLSWSEAYQGFCRASHIVAPHIGLGAAAHGTDYTPPVVGILATLDSIRYHSLVCGIMFTGATVFLISTRNSPLAVAHLLGKTGTTKLFVSPDDQIQGLISAALPSLPEGQKVELLPTPTFEEMYPTNGGLVPVPELPSSIGLQTPAIILHSSGSTSFPKPIAISHKILMQWARPTLYGEEDLGRHTLAAHALPVFHGMGIALIWWATCCGCSLGVFPPKNPPVIPSPENVLAAAQVTKSTVFIVVPSFVELWSRNPDSVEKLKSFHAVGFGGGPLNAEIGDKLVKQGVRLWNALGATEFGIVMTCMPKTIGGPDWQYIELSERVDTYYIPQEDDPNTFELAFGESEIHAPAVFNTVIDGKRIYATNDLVARHPTHPHKMMILGRIDDQIMLSTGEKTNPGPLEAIISRNPLVFRAVMFGRGREQNGVIIQPLSPIDPKDEVAVAKFRNDVWRSVEEANTYAPRHSRIFKEMIVVSDPSKPFELTPKQTVRKGITVAAYSEEIDAVYRAVEQSAQSDVTPPISWTPEEVRNYVRKVVHKVTDKALGDEDDIFQHGGDSLQATWIRNTILRSLRQSPHAQQASKVAQGFVYAYPTIDALASSLSELVGATSTNGTAVDLVQLKLNVLDSLVKEFTANFPKHEYYPDHCIQSFGDVVLLTGTTGGLGAQLLVHLATSASVSKVYAFNRPADKSLRERQTEALVTRGLDARILDSGKVVLVEGKTEEVGFGIRSDLLDEIRDQTTLIIHNAWRVNWALAVASFRPIIQGVRNLVDLALRSPQAQPPRVIFTSSIGLYANWQSASPPTETSIDARVVLGSGYAEAKFVGERILEAAAKETPLRPVIVRVGQMTSTESGAWNQGDWLPAIVRSGQVLHVLPARSDSVAWISLDTAARAIYEFRNSSSQYLHLTHPRPYPWSSVFEPFSKELGVPLVPWTEWVRKLEASVGAPDAAEKNPAVMLLDVFRAGTAEPAEGREAPGSSPLLDMREALKVSESLRELKAGAGEEDAKKWVAYWRRSGLLDG